MQVFKLYDKKMVIIEVFDFSPPVKGVFVVIKGGPCIIGVPPGGGSITDLSDVTYLNRDDYIVGVLT